MPKPLTPRALALGLALFVTPALANDAAKLQPLDIFNLEWASEPAVAPDGRTVAYTRNGFDVMTDRRTERIWLVDRNGERHRPLTDRQGSRPRWSPGGDRLAFVSGTDEGNEVYMHWLSDNRTARITQLPESPGGIRWSPDGRHLAFTMFVPADRKPMVEPPEAPEGASWAPKPKVIETVHYRLDGAGYLEEGFTHVFVLPADGGSARQVTSGNFNHDGGISWAADGKSLYVSANRRDDWEYETVDTDIYRVDLAGGAMTQITDRYGPDQDPLVSPNGRYLAYVGFNDEHRSYQSELLYVLDLDSGERRVLTGDLDRAVAVVAWSDDSRGIYVQYDDRGTGRLGYVNLSGRLAGVADDVGGTAFSRPYTGGDSHAAGGLVAFTTGGAERPADLAVADGRTARRLTSLNDDALGHKNLARVERVTFRSRLDQREIEAWAALPAGFDATRRYPLILEIHGGPFAAYGPQFAAEVQLMAAAGYVVLYVNPRGSSSYGAEFANLIHHAYPGGDFDDLMSAVDDAVARGWADPERLFVTGGSGGGILTAWIVTHTDRFRAAVAAKPVINWYSFVLTADFYPFFQRYWFADLPWKDPEAYLSRSPLTFVDRVTTPTMLLTGEQDYRTPISESEQFYQALKLARVDTALVRIPEAAHGIADRPSHLIAKVQHVLAWFRRHDPAGTD